MIEEILISIFFDIWLLGFYESDLIINNRNKLEELASTVKIALMILLKHEKRKFRFHSAGRCKDVRRYE